MISLKILFIHNTAMWYRIPFFKKLDKGGSWDSKSELLRSFLFIPLEN